MTRHVIAVLCLFLAAPTLAQTSVQTFDLERLSFNPGAKGSLVLGTGQALSKGALRLSLAAQYQHNPLLYHVDGAVAGAVVGSRLSAHLVAAYGITDWLELGLQLPVTLVQTGSDLSAQGIARVDGVGLGSPLVQGQFTILSQKRGAPMDLGGVIGLTLPIGSGGSLGRDTGVAFVPRVGAGRTFGAKVRLGLEVGAVIKQSVNLSSYPQHLTDEVGSIMTVGAVVSTVGAGLRGELNARALVPLTRTSPGFELLAAARYPLMSGGFELFAAAGPGFGRMPGIPAFRALAGFAWNPSLAPACQEESGYALTDCPALDFDRDGISNAADACPEVAGVGGLQGCADKDDDGDGVMNLADACPAVKGAGADGCVAVEAPVAAPVAVVAPLVVIEQQQLTIKEEIFFAPGTSTVLAQSFALLKQTAALLNAHPELAKVQILGHTDNQGSRDSNLALSLRWADAVRAFLINEGVAASRLLAKGRGPDQPIASNDSAAGREQNRRVEFTTDSSN